MKFLSRRVVALTTIASIVCLLSIPTVQAHAQDGFSKQKDDESIDLHGKGGHHHHHHHHKSHKNHHHKSERKRKLKLVCDSVVIDSITCISEVTPLVARSADHQKSFGALNNGGKPKTETVNVYIDMGLPCSAKLPAHCTAAKEMAAEALAEKESEGIEDNENSKLWFKNKNKHHKNHKHSKHEKSGHHHHHHSKHEKSGRHRHHHSKHEDHGKHGKHKKHSKVNHKHPFAGLCVTVGNFCGSALYGCKFDESTLYSCKAVGERPEVSQVGSDLCSAVIPGDACSCLSKGAVCGSSFPAKCGYSENSLYTCTGKGSTPSQPEVCSLNGGSCLHQAGGDDHCSTENTCGCMGKGTYCGGHFPTKCDMKPDVLYACSAAGATPLALSECRYGCGTAGNGLGVCILTKPCTCLSNKDACGSTFPESCKFDPLTVYTCDKAGDTPKPGKQCSGRGCTTKNTVDSTCILDDAACKCDNSLLTCGRMFPAACGFDKGILYDCSGGKGSDPIVSVQCPSGTCTAYQDLNDVCIAVDPDSIDLCKCYGNSPTCGSVFPEFCGLDSSSLYSCSGIGETPVISQSCQYGCNIDNNVGKCLLSPPRDPCTCPNGKAICGSVLPPSCYLSAHAVYKCAGAGAKPTRGTDCDKGCFVDPLYPDHCLPDDATPDCTCHHEGTVCGFNFPIACGLSQAGLYTCSANGEKPVLKETCEGYCFPKDVGTASCSVVPSTKPDDCACSDTSNHCGAAFPDTCGYDPESLYSCSTKGALPVVTHKCADTCYKTSFGNDVCSDNPSQNSCQCRDSHPICGSRYPPSCNYTQSALYDCLTAGQNPTGSTDCPLGCSIDQSGADSCKTPPPLDPCACEDAFQTCGSTFPATCGLDTSAVYTCAGTGATPVYKIDCLDGCTHTSGANDICTVPAVPAECLCSDNANTCGAQFPSTCGYSMDTLYSCAAKGSIPQVKTTCTNGCTIEPTEEGQDFCTSAPVDLCACIDSRDACGAKFPTSCGLTASTLYTCSGAGATPSPKNECTDGCTTNLGGSDDVCTTPTTPPNICSCQDTHNSCGSKFPVTCGYSALTLYSCAGGVETQPVALEECSDGCTVNAGAEDVCTAPTMPPTDCSCKTAENTCGSVFPATCGFATDTLYTCSAVGAAPSASSDCVTGCTVSDPGADSCAVDCTCKYNTATCGSEFPTSCGFDIKSLYQCSAAGAAPVDPSVCTVSCTVNTKADSCAIDPCTCQDNHDSCGSDFPSTCGFPVDQLYSCPVLQAAPQPLQTCAGQCTNNADADDVCAPVVNPACLCQDSTSHCGSFFPAECGLATDSLYKCAAGVVPSLLSDCLPGVCSANVVAGASVSSGPNFKATAVNDFCIDPCACKEANTLVCGSTFPTECNFNSTALMTCAAAGDVPAAYETCTKSCVVQTGSDMCELDPCTCKTTGETCGSTYPSSCGFGATMLYTCSEVDAVPTPSAQCESNEVCMVVIGANDFCGPQTSCSCIGSGATCGSSFPPSCSIPFDTLVTCPAGTSTVCPNGCSNGVCTDGCTCTSDGVSCGSKFGPLCNTLPNALYQCTAGAAPTLLSDCGEQACVSATPSDKCQDPCLCKGSNKVCGSEFPESCGFSNSSIYTCSGVGATPSAPEECTAGCDYTVPDNRCISACGALAEQLASSLLEVVESLKQVAEDTSLGDEFVGTALQPFIDLLTSLATNLTSASADPSLLTTVTGTTSTTLTAAIDLFKSVEGIFGSTTVPLTDPILTTLNTTVLSVLEQLVSCTKAVPGDCFGIQTLYKSFANIAQTTVSTITTPIPDPLDFTSGVTSTISNLLTTVVDDIGTAIDSTTTAALEETGTLLNALIGMTGGNTALYGSTSKVLSVVNDAVELALTCAGVNGTLGDECTQYRAKLQGILVDLIGFIETNMNSVPVVGPLIVSPIVTQLKNALNDLESGATTAVTGVVSILIGIMDIIDIAVPVEIDNPIRDYLQKILSMFTIPPGCGEQPGACTGLISIVEMLADACVELVSQIPLAGIAAKAVLPGFIDSMMTAIRSGSTTAIQTAYDVLATPVGVVEMIPGIGEIATPFRIFLDACKAILDCLVASTPTPTSIVSAIETLIPTEIPTGILPTDIAEVLPTDIAEIIPTDIADVLPTDIAEVIPTDIAEVIPTNIAEVIPTDIAEILPTGLGFF
ncbi:hypothetical protein BGZ76_007314 [Entomortierella beljakovae]|nr:hypothetical protein BGZ76_007314 [Entomortierella beljakovae]